jgi:predicted enzyme related to lactoylglutathione lyase
MVHLRVNDPDRAMEFLGRLLDWESERVMFEDRVSHYTINTTVTVRILDDPAAAAVVPNYRVDHVGRAAEAIRAAGGQILDAEAADDGGGWARAMDDQGVSFLVYRPHQREQARPSRQPSGEVGLVFIRADSQRAQRFYGAVLGWSLERAHPDSNYFDAVPGVGVFDEAAAFGHEVTPAATLYISVPALAPVIDRVEELGGRCGPYAQDMGPYFTTMCTDDQGTVFALISERER